MRRYDFERAVKRADLPGPSVGILLVLATRLNARTGEIPYRHQPSISILARESGYDRSTVKRHLNYRELDGWLTRDRPPKWASQQLHARTAYTLLIPEGYPQARRTLHPELGADSAAAWRTADQELGADGAAAWRTESQELGAAQPGSRRGQRHSTTETGINQVGEGRQQLPDDELTAIARAELQALTGRAVSEATAREAVRLVLSGREIHTSAAAYLRRALQDDPRRYLPASAGPPNVRDLGPDGRPR